MNIKEVNYLKEGFRKTKTFQTIIEGTIQACKDKGDKEGLVEIYRPLFEELYLNGCVQGVFGMQKTMEKALEKIKKYHKEQINAIQKKIGRDISEL